MQLGLIAGQGSYPATVLREARKPENGVGRLVVAAFEGETDPAWVGDADAVAWFRVGQLGALLKFFRTEGVDRAIMAGQITPGRLFDLRPDWKALMLLARLKKRNAESLFGAVAGALEKEGVVLLPATTFMDSHLAGEGWIAGPRRDRRVRRDVEFGWPIAKAVSRMDIGQSIVVKKGTVLAVEGYDGTNATIKRGGALGKGEATLIKVSKPEQDMRFDVPVIGPQTLETAATAGVDTIICETKKTLLLEREALRQLAEERKLTIWGCRDSGTPE